MNINWIHILRLSFQGILDNEYFKKFSDELDQFKINNNFRKDISFN